MTNTQPIGAVLRSVAERAARGEPRMPLEMVGDRVAVRVDAPDEKTPGGLLLPDRARQAPREGVVVAVGPGNPNEDGLRVPPAVRKGDRVLFGWAADEIDHGGEKLTVVRAGQLLGVVPE